MPFNVCGLSGVRLRARSKETESDTMSKMFSYRNGLRQICVALMLTSSVDMARATSVDDLIKKFADFEIGKSGSCERYVTAVMHPDKKYENKQRLLSSRDIGTATAREVNAEQDDILSPYKNVPLLPNGGFLPAFESATETSHLYHVTYQSTTTSGQKVILSGLVVIPLGNMSNGMVVYDHATQVTRNTGAPSHPSHEACTVITALAGKGRVIAMPDYLGYGDNHDPHPYPLGIQNAPAGIDIILAARELAEEVNKSQPMGEALAISGYSEGGGNAQWLARTILEKHPDIGGSRLKMIAPMSGNYDMTGAMAKSLLVDQPVVSDENSILTFASKPLLLGYAAQGAADNSGSTLSSMLKSPFLTFVVNNPLPIPALEMVLYGTKMMAAFSKTGYGISSRNPSSLMTETFVTALNKVDVSVPAVALWKENDITRWIPRTTEGENIPLYVTGILEDQIVPYAGSNYPVPQGYVGGSAYFAEGNSQNLVASLQSQGVTSSHLAWCGIDARKVEKTTSDGTNAVMINHVNGLPPVITLAAKAIETGTLVGLPTIQSP